MKFKFLALIVMCLAASLQASAINISDKGSVEKYGKLVVKELLSRKFQFSGRGGLDYPEVCAALGAFRFSQCVDDKESIDNLIKRYEDFLGSDNSLIDTYEHVDHNVKGLVPLQIFIVNHDERYEKVGLEYADRQWAKEIDGGLSFQTRWWIDDMYMVGSLQMQAYRATGNVGYADKAARQIHAYVDRLQQANGLFYHGPEFPFYWGRGNGWVASAFAEILRDLPEDNKHRAAIVASYKKMMESLLEYQSENGLWRQLVDNKYSWTETSCTAMFAYSMAVGVKLGILEKGIYEPAVIKAWQGLCWHVNRDGKIRDVCMGTNQVNDVEFYLNRPRATGDLHGQAPFLWLAAELLSE